MGGGLDGRDTIQRTVKMPGALWNGTQAVPYGVDEPHAVKLTAKQHFSAYLAKLATEINRKTVKETHHEFSIGNK